MNELLRGLRTTLRDLAPRERLLLAIAGALLAVVLLLLGVVRPVLAARDRSAQRAVAVEAELAAVLRLRRELDEVQGRLSRVEHRIEQSERGNIFTVLESLARGAAVKVDAMEPQASLASDRYRETKVQVVLKSVSLAQTVKYLHAIETASQLLSVKSLRLRTRPDKPELLDVTFTVSSFEPV